MKPCITYTQQRGHAAILFALMIPLLFGVFILGTDGARALQDKARLEEASEVAALAIAGQSGGSEQARNKLATDYIQYYFPHADVNKIETQVIPCEDNEFCDQEGAASERFFEYQVAAHIQEPNWFSKSSIETSFGDNLNVGGYSSARKYQSKSVDVVLVADFSGSMIDPITTKDKDGRDKKTPKYKALQNIISEVADVIASYNEKGGPKKSTLGFVGFNMNTYPSTESKMAYNYIICNTSIDRDYLYGDKLQDQDNLEYSYIDLENKGHVYINGPLKNPVTENRVFNDGWCGQLFSLPVDHGYWGYYSNSIDNEKYIDYLSTINAIFSDKAFNPTAHARDNSMLKSKNKLNFHDIPLTTDVNSLSRKIKRFEPQGGTAFYTGLIRGARMASTGKNPRRLIILLSDGVNSVDDPNQSKVMYSITDKLIDTGLCTRILHHLNDESVDEESVNARMFAIGFGSDYTLDEYPQMKQCVGDNNVYDAKNDSQAIKNKILELIAEEMGRLTPSDEK